MCNDCGEIKNNKCGCKTKVDLKCTFYDGSTLEPLHILNGMTGEEIVVIINNYLKDLILDLQPEPTILKNVGTGAELYKGFSADIRHEIKTLLEGEGIILTETDNSIEIKVSQEFIENITRFNLENVGTGKEVYAGKVGDSHRFRRLISDDGSVTLNENPDGAIDFTVNFPPPPVIPTVDYPVINGANKGSGTPIYKGLSAKNIEIATLKSDTFVITSEEDGSVKINSPGGGSNSRDWYLDANFTRPTNWNTEQNLKEIIDGIPVPNGSLNDPFKTFDEFLLKAIGETGGSNANGVIHG